MSSPAPTPPSTPHVTLLDFTTTPLSKHYGHPNHYALIIDDLLTPTECAALTALAESHSDAWQPAAIKKGATRHEVETDVRDCSRILLDDAPTAEMLYQRIHPFLALMWEIGGTPETGVVAGTWRRGRRWRMTGVNERLRFLRYGQGQFFQAHCDAAYVRAGGRERSFLTVHVYLNSEGEGEEGECRGGATRFWGMNMKEFVDVEARVGRVLVFQQRGLLHSGEVVEGGVKRTLRSDVMYEAVDVEEGSGEVVKLKEESK
ncbi:uncharacterized protein H6S33_009726 [Morchella sextelata]|uniref:uncharacterized protein n=1 Tax=Morchella sextelata TaxID=1174677 RepID=UPI001D03E284|nr:uncharacterized protein H6S33_009726 [Morchella sextelata]KAH0613346.1 hypothetical protein H6S33_009726 [Morchella sextelata]